MRFSVAKKIIIRHGAKRGAATRARRTQHFVCAGMAMVFAVAGCASTPSSALQQQVPAQADAGQWADAPPQVAANYHIMAGEMAAQRGLNVVAAQQYVAALAYTEQPQLARRATRIALFAGQPALAYKAAAQWARLATADASAQRTAARLALGAGEARALARYSRGVIRTAQSTVEGYRVLASILSGRPGHGQLAVQTLAQMVHDDSASAEAWYSLGLVALRYDKVSMAQQAAQQALALEPTWDQAVLLQAATLVRQQQTGPAKALVADLSGTAQDRSDYHLQLARLMLESEQVQAALAEFEQALALRADNSAARYGVALAALKLDDLERAQTALQQLYHNNRRPGRAAFYLGLVHERKQAYATAEKWYRRVDAGSRIFDAGIRAAMMQAQQGKVAAARTALAQLRQDYPKMTPRLYVAEGGMLSMVGHYPQALALYDDALKQLPENTDLLYGRSIVYEKLGRVSDSLADLRLAVKLKPSDPRGLNALGYVLTNHTDKYRYAQQLIAKALRTDPDNPAFLDSMGWVQYQLGRPHKALGYLQRAYKGFPDPEVAAHLGEVLWVLGEHEQARQIWQRSLADNPGSAVLENTINRLTSNEVQNID